ncbi:MAG: YhdP family protein [Pseudomonadota bacterium]
MLIAILRLCRYSWYLIAAALVSLALLAATARLLLLNIDQQNQWVETWLSRTFDRPVSIGELKGNWHGWSPSIQIDKLSVYEPDSTTALVHFEQAAIEISIRKSLQQFNLVPRKIILGGVKFTLERGADGQFAIAGMPPSRWPVAQWIEGQNRFSLTKAHIEYIDNLTGYRQVFEDLSLTIERNQNNRRISGKTIRQGQTSEEWRFAIEADDTLLSSDWNGKISLKVTNFDLTQFKQFNTSAASKFASTPVDLTMSSEWSDAKLRYAFFALRGPASGSDITSGSTNTAFDIEGNLNRTKNGWALGFVPNQINAIAYDPDDQPVLKARWLEDSSRVLWEITNLRLEDWLPLVEAYLATTESHGPKLRALSPTGRIVDARFLSTRDRLTTPQLGRIRFEELAWQEAGDVPKVQNLAGVLNFANDHGTLAFESNRDVLIASEKWLESAVTAANIDGAIEWHRTEEGIRLSTTGLHTEIETIDIETRGSVGFYPDQTDLNVFARINAGKLNHIRNLVPKKVLPPKGERWARRTFLSGNINVGALVLRGALQEFPFDKQEGVFRVFLEANEADMKYGAKWPAASDVSGLVEIENRRADFQVTSGKIYSSDVTGAKISIANLFTKKRYVEVSSKTNVLASEVVKFIDDSPLKNTKAKRFKELEIEKPFSLALDLNLGIYPGGDKDVLGLAEFKGNRIESKNLKLALDELVGNVSFTRHDWYGEGLTATFRGNRVGVLLNGGLDDPNYDTEIRLTGTSGPTFLLEQLAAYAPTVKKLLHPATGEARLSGQTAWKAVISLPGESSDKVKAPRKLTVDSSLQGLGVDLPWPLGKNAAQSLPIRISVSSPAQGTRTTNLSFGDRFEALLSDVRAKPTDRPNFQGAQFWFGSAAPAAQEPKSGIDIRGTISQLDPTAWRQIARESLSSNDMAANLPTQIDLTVENLDAMGNAFKDVKVEGHNNDDGWLLRLESESLSGEITAPQNDKLPVKLKLSRLHLQKVASEKSESAMDPSHVRPFSLESLSTSYGDIELGKVSVSVERVPGGIRVNNALAEHGHFDLRASGEWTKQGSTQQSNLDLTIGGRSLAALLGSFGYDIANIEGGVTQLDLNANWPGSPLDFRMDLLRGHLGLSVESGRFLDIEPGGGRLFGLLSLQTLPRRLALDFNDLFAKGFAFDNIVGNFSIDEGHAYTNGLIMDGPSARIQISGRTGLSEQDYDQRVTVTPALSNSIPVASALFGPAGIGVGAVIYLGQKMFKSIPEQVDKILTREYSITGEWSSPVIEKI